MPFACIDHIWDNDTVIALLATHPKLITLFKRTFKKKFGFSLTKMCKEDSNLFAKVGIFSFLGISYIMVSHREPRCYSPIVTTTPFTPGLSGLYQEYIQNGVRLFLSDNIKRRWLIFKTVHKLFPSERDWTDLLPGNIIP